MLHKTISGYLMKAIRSVSLPGTASELGSSTDTVLILDVSGSMEERDLTPCRLAAAQAAAAELLSVQRASGSIGRFGVGAFADVGFPICPLSDLGSAAIDRAIRSLKAKGSTNMGSGLKIAEHFFSQAQGDAMQRRMVFLSDGVNQKGEDPTTVAERMKSAGCEIHTVGIGSKAKGLDEELLRALASRDPSGNPLYRLISDRNGLVRHFGELGGLTR